MIKTEMKKIQDNNEATKILALSSSKINKY